MESVERNVFILGAVAYDPKVVTIWDGFARFFAERGLAFDYVLYTTYERLVRALDAGHVHAAWNSPLAWLQSERLASKHGTVARAIVMRDSDQDLRSAVLVRADAAFTDLPSLRGRAVAVGAADSPQATLLPLDLFAQHGVDVKVQLHDVLTGKHGDHIGGEREAVRALLAGKADAACVLDANLLGFAHDGTLPAGSVRVLAQTEPYDHCSFTVLGAHPTAQEKRFTELLLAMRYEDPAVRPLMDLEGLKAWRVGRTSLYAPLARAVGRTGYLDAFVAGA